VHQKSKKVMNHLKQIANHPENVEPGNINCPSCNADIDGVEHFRDQASVHEYAISGLCQSCQDDAFCGGE